MDVCLECTPLSDISYASVSSSVYHFLSLSFLASSSWAIFPHVLFFHAASALEPANQGLTLLKTVNENKPFLLKLLGSVFCFSNGKVTNTTGNTYKFTKKPLSQVLLKMFQVEQPSPFLTCKILIRTPNTWSVIT